MKKESTKKESRSLSWLSLKVFASLFLILILPACQKASINGHLDGRWQVMEVTPDPEIEGNERLYYSFYLHVCQLTYYGGVFTEANMNYIDNLLTLDFPYATNPEITKNLRKYGINSNPITFSVEFPDKDKLILRNGDTVVTLRRF